MELQWHIDDDHFVATSPVGKYEIGEGARGRSVLSFPKKLPAFFEVTLEEAMEMAQEDLDRRLV